MHTLGSARVSVKDGFVISAVDTESRSRWTANDLRQVYPRRLTHLLMMAVAVVPVTASAASAHGAPTGHQRIQLVAATVPDHPEDIRGIPADVPPPPAATPALALAPAAAINPAAKPAYHFVVPASRAQIAQIIRDAAARHGVDGDRMLRVAMCESGLNPNAQNRSGATGLFQFKPATFYGHGGHNIWDPADQAEIAARMFAQGYASAWTCR
jgi:hypothetical protein